MTYLLDINVLVALFDRNHPHHDPAHRWFAAGHSSAWATCPLTENGFIRIVSNPVYPKVATTPVAARNHLSILCAHAGHVFWPDVLSLTDVKSFDITRLQGHQQITDLYLVALAAHFSGALATFDSTIPIAALVGASASVVEVIPTA